MLVGRVEPAALVDAEQYVGANEVLSLDCLADTLVQADRVRWLASPFAAKAIKHWPEGERIHGTANCSARENRGNDMKEGLWKEKSIETLRFDVWWIYLSELIARDYNSNTIPLL